MPSTASRTALGGRSGRLLRLSAAAAVAAAAATGCVAHSRAPVARTAAADPRTSPSASPAWPSGADRQKGFTVAPPEISFISGPAPARKRPCRPGDVRATAEQRSAEGAVLGVVHLVGKHCSLLPVGAPRLLDAAGRPLRIPVRQIGPVNPPVGVRPDLSVAAGDAGVGWSWRGSWCGAGPAPVRIILGTRRTEFNDPRKPKPLDVPLTGTAVLPCRPGRPSSLVPGLWAEPHTGLLPPDPSWSALRATLVLPRTVDARFLRGWSVVLKNTGRATVVLSPCPSTALAFLVSDRGGATGGQQGGGDLCAGAPIRIAPRATSTLPIPETPIPGYRGERLDVTWAIAGVPSARAVATLS